MKSKDKHISSLKGIIDKPSKPVSIEDMNVAIKESELDNLLAKTPGAEQLIRQAQKKLTSTIKSTNETTETLKELRKILSKNQVEN